MPLIDGILCVLCCVYNVGIKVIIKIWILWQGRTPTGEQCARQMVRLGWLALCQLLRDEGCSFFLPCSLFYTSFSLPYEALPLGKPEGKDSGYNQYFCSNLLDQNVPKGHTQPVSHGKPALILDNMCPAKIG